MRKQRETITVNVDPLVAKRFREVVDKFGGKIGLCVTASLVLFIRASEEERKELIQSLYLAQLDPDELEKFLNGRGGMGKPKRANG